MIEPMFDKHDGKALVSLLIFALWLASVISAVGVVYSTFEARKATQKLEALRREASGLKVVSGQFLLEKSTWSAYARVESVAQKELDMVLPEGEETILVYKK